MRQRPLEAADAPFALPLDIAPMEARTAAALPGDEGTWHFEPKWDGFRCLAFKAGDAVALRAKSGKPLDRYFPEVVATLRDCAAERFVADGELVIPQDGGLSFDALQMRLHPAESRVRKLSVETPARLIAFDLLQSPGGATLLDQPLGARREALERFVAAAALPGRLDLSPATADRALEQRWLGEAGAGPTDGVVAKRVADPTRPANGR